MVINSFRGSYSFLSNFNKTKVIYEGREFICSESAFQSAKCKIESQKDLFVKLDGPESKHLGRKVLIIDDWEKVKDKVMYDVVKSKFDNNDYLRLLLLQTKDLELIEGNTWHDNYWGVCSCSRCKSKGIIGKNMLGKTLMKIRAEYRNK